VATARAKVQTAKAELAETQLQAGRERQLAERGVSPKATVDDLVAKERSQGEAARAAEAEVGAADAEVQALTVNLQDMTVTAPLDGVVTEKLTSVGELVGPQAGTLFEVVDFSSLEVELDVPEGKLEQVKLGSPAEIVLDAFPSKRWRGATSEIGKKVDRAKAT